MTRIDWSKPKPDTANSSFDAEKDTIINDDEKFQLIFRHPLLKLEKINVFGQPPEPKKYAYHGQNFRKVHFKAVRAGSRSVLA